MDPVLRATIDAARAGAGADLHRRDSGGLAALNAPIDCPLCGQPASRIFAEHHAYVAPDRFDVHECRNCDTRFAWPLGARTEVYDQIYACREKLPGYDRYERLRVAIAISSDPLQTLAEFEDVYWGVKVALEGVEAQAEARGQAVGRVLELGSGMGYLTHAMRSRGFAAEGWDVSAQAVNQACLAFGPHFRVCDVSGTLESHEADQLYDAVVATELIEHLEDPQALVRRAAKLLVPGGRLILTTPNREIYPPSMAWHTDAAPVHLWWFSKASMRRMAWAAGMSVSFVDFGPFYGRRGPPVTRATKPQPINAGGRVIFKDSLVHTIARSLMARWPATSRHIGRVFLRQLSEQSHRERAFHDSLSMCAVLRKPRL